MNLNSSVMHRLHFDQMELLSTLWERLELAPDMPPALVKWNVSPLCVPSNKAGFCVCVCVSKRSWAGSGESTSARFASLHTNAGQCQSFIQKHSPTDSCCNILYEEEEEGRDPPWVSKLICPLRSVFSPVTLTGHIEFPIVWLFRTETPTPSNMSQLI